MNAPRRDEPSVRGFGAVMALAGALLAWRLQTRGVTSAAAGVASLGLALAALSVVAPSRARPLARAWQRLGEALGRVTTPVMLTAVFVLVVIPTRALMALARVDPLQRGFRRDVATYWSERRDGRLGREGFERPW
ncbi:MAG: SxtJ family membrane protein [Polyangiales bacterium]